MPIALDGIRTCISGIRTHRASDYTTTAGTPPVCVCVCVCQRKTKDRADGMRKKVPIPLDGIRTCTSGIRANRASDYTTRERPPRVSRNKHFRHSPVSSIAKQSCMTHSNSYLRDRDVKHLQGPPLSRTKRDRERRN